MTTQSIPHPKRGRSRFAPNRLHFWESLNGWLFAMPWILGLLFFLAAPILISFVMSFTDWDVISPPTFIGLDNYVEIFQDALFYQSMKVTTLYALVAVPLQVALGIGIAVLLNSKIRYVGLYRTLFYLPAVLPVVATAVIWRYMFSRDWGLINMGLSTVGITGPSWLADPNWALMAMVVMSLWSVGSSILIYLAGLQGIPTELYEAAKVDGAGPFTQFRHITVPMLSPVIFFQLVVGLISAFQVFAQPQIMTDGGPQNATLFYLLYLYRNAFQFFRMGYASALSWVLFIYIVGLTLLVIRSSAAWVYYEGEMRDS